MSQPRREANGEMTAHDFLNGVIGVALKQLPAELRPTNTRVRWGMAQLHFGDRTQHYEVWLRRSVGLVEIGLHCESRDREHNSALVGHLAEEMLCVRDELGEGIDAEQWDRGWTRIHCVRPLATLDASGQELLGELLVSLIGRIEPLRREALEAIGPAKVIEHPHGHQHGHGRGRWRR